MLAINFPKEAAEYKNQWVAFSMDLKEIVGYGSTMLSALAMARENGEAEAYPLFIPEKWPEALLF